MEAERLSIIIAIAEADDRQFVPDCGSVDVKLLYMADT